MQISKVTLMLLSLGAAACQLGAQPASPDLQDKALQLLRQTISEDRARGAEAPRMANPPATHSMAAPAANATTAPAPTANPAKPRSTPKPARMAPKVNAPPPEVQPAPAPTMPEANAGPKTKQQRLTELLELYKADKLSPPEYHAQRAKILAEP